ncbi:two-component sensor histidine kinase [Calothrix sp. NIES-4101]|nr:two-component sensor histidine kinase [Calothrix sp. NIES-4101]
MTGLFRSAKRRWKQAVSTYITPTTNVINVKYETWQRKFLWQRLRLWSWLALICVISFVVRDIYNFFSPLREFADLPKELMQYTLLLNGAILLSIIIAIFLHRTRFGRRYPGGLFLGLSWSISLGQQIFSTLKGFALPDLLTWSLLFLGQATFMPVRWTLHLISQIVLLIYYFGVNFALGFKVPTPNSQEPIYNVTFILYIFWLCAICDLSVYLYDRLQSREFQARKELEITNTKLQITEAKYRSIFENAVEGIFQSTPDGRYITANPALARIFGFSTPEELINYFTDIGSQLYVNPQRRLDFVRLIEEFGSVSEFESQIYRHNPNRDNFLPENRSIVWISEKAYTVCDARGNILYYEGIIEDITQRKRAEEALRVFFHAVSHDLRNPVLGTLMVLRNLLSTPGQEGDVDKGKSSLSSIPVSRLILERMLQSGERQLNLINTLMEAHVSEVRGISLQLQPVSLHQVAEDAIADLKPTLTENQATLTNLIATDLPAVEGDSFQLWRVFNNLIGNSLKHNPPGLTITVDAKIVDHMIYCTVSDNGVGMTQQQCERLFDLYFRGENVRNSLSLGLGLYLCKQIIKAHKGEINVKSSPNQGAIFWFTLPLMGTV